MAYQKQTFVQGQTLTAEAMNHIEDGIGSAHQAIEATNNAVANKQDKLTIDTVLSSSSSNPVQNKAIKAEIDKKQDKLVSGSNIKTINGQSLVGGGNITIDSSGNSIAVDSALSATSTNPVQNKVVKAEFDKKQEKLVSGTSIKTVNGQSLLGSGDIVVEGGDSISDEQISSAVGDYLEKNPVSAKPTTKPGLKVAVFGDSISTQLNLNAVEITIENEDIGVELSAYPTSHDIGKTIGGYKITADDLGKELTFVPTSSDLGKTIGGANNYNKNLNQTWWQYVQKELGCEVIPVTYSSSSICSHEANSTSRNDLVTAHAWHPSQIRKAGKRIPGTMQREAPDVIIIYRGTNDVTHTPYAVLTDGYFDSVNWKYPVTDTLSGGQYGAQEAIALTIKKLRSAYPKAQIVLATLNVFKRINYENFPTNNGLYSLPQWNNMIRKAGDFFGCHVIEFDKDGITFENCYDQGYITDSSSIPTHPNDSGHLLMGKQALSDLVNKLHICDIEPTTYIYDGFDKDMGENILYDGLAVRNTDGALYSATGYYAYDRVPVKANTTYQITNCRNTALLNANNQVISITEGATLEANGWLITTTEDTAFIRTCAKTATMPAKDFTIVEVDITEPEETNILHNNTLVNINNADLTEDSTNTYFTYALVPVEGGAYYNIPKGRNVAFLNVGQTFISGVNVTTDTLLQYQVQAPTNAKYLQVCFKYEDIAPEDVVIEKTTTTIAYSASAVNPTTGKVDNSSSYKDYWCLDMIPVEPNTTYRLTNCRNTAELDANGSLVKLTTGSEMDAANALLTTQSRTAYIRTCAKTATMSVNSFVLEKVS